VPTVRFPQPFKQLSGKRTLVMERVHYAVLVWIFRAHVRA
jgi:hypothetical protein